MTTLGQLISTLFANYERQLHDRQLAGVATQVALEELLHEQRRRQRRK